MAFLYITLIFAVLMASMVVQEANAQDISKPHLYRRNPAIQKAASSKPAAQPPSSQSGQSAAAPNSQTPVVDTNSQPSKQETSWKKTKIFAGGVAAAALGSALLNDGPDYGPGGPPMPMAPMPMPPMPMAPMMPPMPMAPMPGYYY